MEEPVGVRLARIEEGLVYAHKKMDDHHEAQMALLRPLVDKVQKHEVKFAVLKRDYRWVFLIATVGVPFLFTGVELYLHYFRT